MSDPTPPAPPDPVAAAPLRVQVGKAIVVGNASPDVRSQVLSPDDDSTSRLFNEAGGLEPPYPPLGLLSICETSNCIRQNVDAMATNVDGFGHTFEPVVDFDAADADQRVAQIIRDQRRIAAKKTGEPPSPEPPTAEEIAAKRAELVEAMRSERVELERWFDQCCEDLSFTSLRMQLRRDLEQQGNAYMEVLRNNAGDIVEVSYVPAFTMRLMAMDRQPTSYIAAFRDGDVDFGDRPKQRRFRRFVQVLDGLVVYFKEYGDPRTISRRRGTVHADTASLAMLDMQDSPATEIIHLRIHSSRSSYGIPRWIGVLLEVTGSHQAAQVNNAYFDNKAVPPLALLISGGRLASDSVGRIESYIQNEVKGVGNFHKILVIEAEAAGGNGGTLDSGATGTVRMDFKELTGAQLKDGLFQAYDERNRDKVGESWRLPRLLRGDSRDFNRATAEAAVDFTEQQVFAPARQEFDDVINRTLLMAMKVRFWRYRSRGPKVRNTKELGDLIRDLTAVGVLTPGEARELCEDVFGRELKNLDAAWTKQPLALTQAGIIATGEDGVPYTGDDNALDERPDSTVGEARSQALQVTPSATAAAVTVNEIRQSQGLGPLLGTDGGPDPMGDLTMAEFQARRAAAIAPGGGVIPAGADVIAAGKMDGARVRPGLRAKRASVGLAGIQAIVAAMGYADALRTAAGSEAAARFETSKRDNGGDDAPDEAERL